MDSLLGMSFEGANRPLYFFLANRVTVPVSRMISLFHLTGDLHLLRMPCMSLHSLDINTIYSLCLYRPWTIQVGGSLPRT